MSRVAELLSPRRAPQAALLAAMSFAFAGCSADMQSRLSQSPNFSPYGQAEATGSVPRAPAPVVQRQELPQYARPQYSAAPQYQSQPLPPPIAPPQSYPAVATAPAMPSYTAPARSPIETTGGVAPRSIAATQKFSGGNTIIVGTSDTLDIIAKRYNVSQAAILQASGYRGPRALSPGQSLVIPHQTAAAPAAAIPVKQAAAAPAMPGHTHFVNGGDTLVGVARRNNVSAAELARANGLPANAALKPGMKLTVPAAKTADAAPVETAPAALPAVSPAPVAKIASAVPAEPMQKVRMATATTTPPEMTAAENPVKAAEATGALPTFRWPVRGRVIAGYGAKTGGKSNDGINVAVPEGTPVKAAEDGVVAYAGNELKGYGNLVLVRHSNGYVTAYAHTSELDVKRGDTVKRGQVIAKSGQSGEVGSPQLHFEIRKGSSPVDPQQFLSGG